MQADFCGFRVSLIYLASSLTAKVLYRVPTTRHTLQKKEKKRKKKLVEFIVKLKSTTLSKRLRQEKSKPFRIYKYSQNTVKL